MSATIGLTVFTIKVLGLIFGLAAILCISNCVEYFYEEKIKSKWLFCITDAVRYAVFITCLISYAAFYLNLVWGVKITY